MLIGVGQVERADEFKVGHRLLRECRLPLSGASVVRAERRRHERGALPLGLGGLPQQSQLHL